MHKSASKVFRNDSYTRWKAFGARRNAMQNWSDKHTSDWIFTLKLSPKIVQKPAPRGPNGSQNPFWRPPGKPSWREVVFWCLEEASRTSFGMPFGSRKSFQTHPGSVSKTHVTSNSVLERFWNPLETEFEAFLKSLRDKKTSRTDKIDEVEMFQKDFLYLVLNCLDLLVLVHFGMFLQLFQIQM
mgnify:CR=1 FL=1